MESIFRSIGKTIAAVWEVLVLRPIRERGLLWTFAAWVLVLSTISFWGEVASRGLLFTGVIWFLALLAFSKIHHLPKRMARQIPFSRSRKREHRLWPPHRRKSAPRS